LARIFGSFIEFSNKFGIIGKFDGGFKKDPLDLTKPVVNGKVKYK